MKSFRVKSSYDPAGDQGPAIEKLSEALLNGADYQTLKGVTGSGKTYTMAKVIERVQKPTLIISHNKTLAAQLYREFKDFFPENSVEYFVSYYDYYQPEAYVPSKDLYIEKDSSINDEIDRLRLSATAAIMDRKDVIIVATVSCIFGLGDPTAFHSLRAVFSRGTQLDINEIKRRLITLQYNRNDNVLERGVFRVRGDILEIYPAYAQYVYRIEMNWDEIERIRKVHPLTGETLEEMDQCILFPAKHFVMPQDQIKKAVSSIQEEFEIQYEALQAANKIVEAERLKSRTAYDLDMMKEIGYCSGIENYSRHLIGREPGSRPYVLLDYFPDDFLTFIDEAHVTIPQLGAMYEGDRSRKQTLVDHGFRLPSALDNRPLKADEVFEKIRKAVFVTATPREKEIEKSKQVVELINRPTGLLDPVIEVRPTEGQMDFIHEEINKEKSKGNRILITTLTKKMAEDLTDFLAELGHKVRYLHSDIETIERVEIIRDLRQGVFDVLIGINLLREGLDMPEVSTVMILDADKIGFLRSTTSLIQTIGRAARNLDGRVIMFADRYSDAMNEAIEETKKRRAVQEEYNNQHGITPVSIKKKVQEILVRKSENKQEENAADELSTVKKKYNIVIAKERNKMIKDLEALMLEHAKRLEFEEAALIRDEIDSIKKNFS